MHRFNLALNMRLHEDAAPVGGTSNEDPGNGSPEAQAPVVVYGKQDTSVSDPAPTATDGQSSPAQSDVAARQAEFAKAKDAYKDLYQADLESNLSRRLSNHTKEVNSLKGMLGPIMAYMNIDTMDQLKEFVSGTVLPEVQGNESYQKLVEALQISGNGSGDSPPEEVALNPADLAAQAATLSETLKGYGVDFDYAEASKAPEFSGLLRKGLSVPQAYFALNHESILLKAGQSAAEAAKNATIESVRTKGINAVTESASRPAQPVIVKDNPANWDDGDMADVIKRVQRGEKIRL